MKPLEIKFRLERDGKSQADLARHLGLDPAIVNRILKGTRKLSSDEADAIRQFLPDAQAEQNWVGGQTLAIKEDASIIAEMDVRAGSGGGGLVIEDYAHGAGGSMAVDGVRSQWAIPAGFLKELVGVRGADHIRIVEIIGDSNVPELHSGDRVFVDLSHRTPSPSGFYCLWDGSGVVVKSVEIIPGADPVRLNLISENEKYNNYEVSADEANIIGRVCGKISRM